MYIEKVPGAPDPGLSEATIKGVEQYPNRHAIHQDIQNIEADGIVLGSGGVIVMFASGIVGTWAHGRREKTIRTAAKVASGVGVAAIAGSVYKLVKSDITSHSFDKVKRAVDEGTVTLKDDYEPDPEEA